MTDGTAMLVIDVQRGITLTGDDPAYQGEEVLARIKSLVDRARAAGTPVLYLQHDGPEGSGDLEPGTPGWEIEPAVAPQPGEPVIRKKIGDGFYQTALQAELDKRGIHHIVIAGCATEQCIDANTRSALRHGYDVTLAGDAHTTYDWENITAAQLIEFHNTALPYVFEPDHPDHHIEVKPAAEIEF